MVVVLDAVLDKYSTAAAPNARQNGANTSSEYYIICCRCVYTRHGNAYALRLQGARVKGNEENEEVVYVANAASKPSKRTPLHNIQAHRSVISVLGNVYCSCMRRAPGE